MCGDALWRLPVTVCRITGFLGPEVSQTLLDRVTAIGVGSLQPSTGRSTRDVDTRIRHARPNDGLDRGREPNGLGGTAVAAAGAEVLLKARLQMVHWSLVFVSPGDATREALERGH